MCKVALGAVLFLTLNYYTSFVRHAYSTGHVEKNMNIFGVNTILLRITISF